MIINVLLVALLVILSAFFASSEMSFASSNKLRIKQRFESSPTLLVRWAKKMTDDFEDVLSTILVCNNLVSTAASSVAAVIVIDLLGESFAWVATLVMTIILLIFGEIAPKIIAKALADKAVYYYAFPMRILCFIFFPLNKVVVFVVNLISKLWKNVKIASEGMTEDDLESMIELAESEGVIEEERSDLLQNALNFDEVLAYQIITPRVDMLYLDIDEDYSDILETITESKFSRIPFYEGTVDNIIGILHLNRFYKALVSIGEEQRVNIRSILMEPVFVHKTMPLPQVLSKMKEEKSHMVIVTDEYGGTMGILTMEDVLEQIVGEIWDESDEVEVEVTEINDTEYDISGDMRIFDFFDLFDLEDADFEDDNATVGGWITDMLEGEVEEGSILNFENLTIKITEMSSRRIERIHVLVGEAEEEEEDLF
ncbi:MAG: HlyC/CorC family transporter [Ruminococcaceae bacterium]|nr:HlyC/CorC family transporter [Oscillospiraceae bacterium]